MTVVVAFLCTDGAVIAADSMLTTAIGDVDVAHHTGKKVSVLNGHQIFAFAGDQGRGARFRITADSLHAKIKQAKHPLDHSLCLTQEMIKQFKSTGIGKDAINLNTVLAYEHGGKPHCCLFEGIIQPRLLDEHHFYGSLGIGKLSADPFLRFLVDVFCQDGPPNVTKGIFLATWTIEHVIRTNPGGVAGPIRTATLERDQQGTLKARELPDTEIDRHRLVIEEVGTSLRTWRDRIQSGVAAEDARTPELDEG